MFDTYVTVIGNVLTAPEWRRTAQSGALVANFKVASTARRLDRETGRWVDGNSLRVRVNCWRRLAEGVASSVMVGDPVVVVGRLYTRDWTDDAGNHRSAYELEAVAVGHDLSRGRARFVRNRPAMATSTVEDAEADARVRGEATEPVPADQFPTAPGGAPGLDDEPFPVGSPSPLPGYDPVAMVRGVAPVPVPDSLTGPRVPLAGPGSRPAGAASVVLDLPRSPAGVDPLDDDLSAVPDDLPVMSDGLSAMADDLSAAPVADHGLPGDPGSGRSELPDGHPEPGVTDPLPADGDRSGGRRGGERGRRGRSRVPVPA